MATVTMLTFTVIDCDMKAQYMDITVNPNIPDFHSLGARCLDMVFQYDTSIEYGT